MPPAFPPTPSPAMPDTAAIRRNLRASIADGIAFSVMVGCGETFIAPFALAVGLGPVLAGLIATLPILFGAAVQLLAPLAVRTLGTNRGWVVACVGLQAASFLPLAWWAWTGHAHPVALFITVGVYWASGMASSPAWNAWIGTIVPANQRVAFFAQRNRLSQAGVLAGFVAGGATLQIGQRLGHTLEAFAVLFVVAGLARFISMLQLARCDEPEPPASLAAASDAAAARPLFGSSTGTLLCYLWGMSATAQFAAPYFTPYMLDEMGFSYWAFMIVIATSFLAKSLSLPMLGRIASRIGSVGLLWAGGASVVPLSLLWLVSADLGWLVGVQIVAGVCWAAYELAMTLLFFDAVSNRDRAAVVSAHTFGTAIATVAGAAAGGAVLRALGEDQTAYFAVFAISAALRGLTLPLLLRLRSSRLLANARHAEP
jgi:MFS family permease